MVDSRFVSSSAVTYLRTLAPQGHPTIDVPAAWELSLVVIQLQFNSLQLLLVYTCAHDHYQK